MDLPSRGLPGFELSRGVCHEMPLKGVYVTFRWFLQLLFPRVKVQPSTFLVLQASNGPGIPQVLL